MKTERIELRVSTDFVELVDNWRRQQRDIPSRAEAIRILVEKAIAGVAIEKSEPPKQASKKQRILKRAP